MLFSHEMPLPISPPSGATHPESSPTDLLTSLKTADKTNNPPKRVEEESRAAESLHAASNYNRSLIEASLDPLVTIGPDGRITDVNSATEKATGCSRAELVGTDFSDYFTDPEKARKGYQQVFREGSVRDYPLELRHIDGSLMSVLYNASVYRDPEKNVVGVFAAARDITGRKQAEMQKEQYLKFFMLSSDGMCIADPFGCFRHVNPAFAKITGYRESELISKPFIDFVLPEDRRKTVEEMKLQTKGRPSLNFENRYLRKDGSVITLAWTAFFDHDDGVTYATARDITERKLAEETLRVAGNYNRRLIEASLDPLVTIGPDGKITDVNTATEKATGHSREELIGTDFSDYFTEPGKAREGYEQAFREGEVWDYPLQLRHRSGTVISVLYNASVYRSKEGDVVGVFAAARDITELEQAMSAVSKSEARFRSLVTALSEIVWTTTPEGLVRDDIPAWRAYTGQTYEELKGSGWSNALHPDDLAPTLSVWQQAVKNRSPYKIEYRIRRHDGEYRYFATRGVPVIDLSGAVREWVGLCTDIHESKLSEEKILHLASIVESSDDAIIGKSLDEIILSWNRGAERIYGYRPDEIVGRPVSVLVPADLLRELAEIMERLKRGESIEHFETTRVRKDGKPIFVSLTISPIKDSSGKIVGASSVARDITERWQAEQKIQKLNEELEQRVVARTAQLESANKELEAFAYSVSHDLRAPLRSIDGFSKILLEDCADKLDEAGRENLQIVRNASQRMAHLIDDILQLSRLNRSPLRLLPVDLSALAVVVADDLKKLEPERRVDFLIEPGCVALADGNQIRVLLENLIGNAWKFTGKRPEAKIEFGREIRDGIQVFYVRDNGVGFDMKYSPKLFGAFQRLHSVNEFPGTGIGLASVQRIIHRHGGKVWLDGRVDDGATAYFSLPKPEQNHENKNHPSG